MQLREYQTKLIDAARESFGRGNKFPLIVAPTGSGKTVLFSAFTKGIVAKGNSVLILAHRIELLEQISKTLVKFNLSHSVIAPNYPDYPNDRVHVGSVFTCARRELKNYDVVIIDEAHHCIGASTFGKVIARVNPKWRLGVTATPCRLSGEPLGEMFDDLILGPTTRELINQNHLSDYRIFAPGNVSLAGVHTRGGDFVTAEIESAMDKPAITGSAINEYKKHADGKRALVFCTTIKHAENVRDQFIAAGYRAENLDGTMDSKTRSAVVSKFTTGETQVLTSVNVVSEGFDLPAIEVAILLRPTQSTSLYLQQVGRALRIFPGKTQAIILDHAGNTARHGLPCSERVWSLTSKIKPVKASESSPSVKICEKCFAAQESGKPQCIFCGFVFPIKQRLLEEIEGDLAEIDVAKFRIKKKIENVRAQTKEQLVELARARGYKNPHGWAHFIYQARMRKRLGMR